MFSNSGWWRRPDGSRSGGAGKTLVCLVRASEAGSHRVAVQAVIDEIKKRYRYRSVLWEEDWVCAAFSIEHRKRLACSVKDTRRG